MRSIVNLSTKLSIAGLAVLMGMSAAFANTLSEVEINALDNGYGIVLKTDETTEMKKIVSSDNKMTLQLKDVEVSPDLNTVYNNVADIENVTVVPSGKSDIKIVFKGEGISNSKVAFANPKTQAVALKKSTTQSIELSGPVSSYTPVYNPDAFVQEVEADQTSNPQINEVLTTLHVSKEMLVTAKKYAKKAVNKTKSGDINLVTVMGVIFIFAALLLRPKKRKAREEKQQSLSQMLARPQNTQPSAQMEREIALNRRLADNMPLSRPDGLGAVNPVNAGYGMKAYQNSQRNPYVSDVPAVSGGVSGIPRRRPLNSQPVKRTAAPVKKQTIVQQPVAQPVQSPMNAKRPSMLNPAASKPVRKNAAAAEPSDMDSMKFLESITKIYEKNGRTDLAKGLKENLRKAQMSGVTRNF